MSNIGGSSDRDIHKEKCACILLVISDCHAFWGILTRGSSCFFKPHFHSVKMHLNVGNSARNFCFLPPYLVLEGVITFVTHSSRVQAFGFLIHSFIFFSHWSTVSHTGDYSLLEMIRPGAWPLYTYWPDRIYKNQEAKEPMNTLRTGSEQPPAQQETNSSLGYIYDPLDTFS